VQGRAEGRFVVQLDDTSSPVSLLTAAYILLFTRHVRTPPGHNASLSLDSIFLLISPLYILFACLYCMLCLQCFDAVGWAAGRASELFAGSAFHRVPAPLHGWTQRPGGWRPTNSTRCCVGELLLLRAMVLIVSSDYSLEMNKLF